MKNKFILTAILLTSVCGSANAQIVVPGRGTLPDSMNQPASMLEAKQKPASPAIAVKPLTPAQSNQAQIFVLPSATQPVNQPATGTQQTATLAPASQQVAIAVPSDEAKGYSLAFIANKYNQACGLGVSPVVIGLLEGELKKAEAANQIDQATINKNVADSQRLFKENPAQFCADAQQIAQVIKGMYPGQ